MIDTDMPSCLVPIETVTAKGIHAFYAFWDMRRDGNFAPSWAEFRLEEFDPSLIPFVVVSDVEHDPLNFRFRFWGTAHVDKKGFDRTGLYWNEPHQLRGEESYLEHRWVVEKRSPMVSQSTIELDDGGFTRAFEQVMIRAPLSSDGENVTQIISLAQWM